VKNVEDLYNVFVEANVEQIGREKNQSVLRTIDIYV
jgi:hypothetical protein|tara:strand:+ start:220 stop:327 length:108 start_codon:yes stop_codon:yes gene_type:complete